VRALDGLMVLPQGRSRAIFVLHLEMDEHKYALPTFPKEWRNYEPGCLPRRYIENSASLMSTIYQDSHKGTNS
jgi:hypothetical protein